MNILIVDDDPSYRMLLRDALGQQDWTIFLAEHGEEAMSVLSREKLDIVVSDVYMPVMDGIALHRKVRSTSGIEKIPFLFVSAYDDQHTLSAIKDPKLEAFLQKTKPISLVKEWIIYLTTPPEQRPKLPPGKESYTRQRETTGDRRRTR